MWTSNCALVISVCILAVAKAKPSPKIVGGIEANPHQFPYQISLQWNYNDTDRETMHFCGASILNENWVMTAGHCNTRYSHHGFIEVVAGAHDVSHPENYQEQRRTVKQFIVHENYPGGVAPNDIALIELNDSLVFNDNVKPVILPEKSYIPSGDATISGWGSVSTSFTPIYPDKLRFAVIPIIEYRKCKILWGLSPLAFSNICGGTLNGSRTVCSADSGSPLVQSELGNIVQIGIVSWGAIPCGTANRPAVFARVSHFIDWIENKINH